MSEQDQSVSDTPNEINSVNSSEMKNDKVAYDTYRKTVEKEKSLREKTRTLETELDAYKQKDMESQGRYEELISGLKEKVSTLENENKSVRGDFAISTIDGAIERELVKRNCKKPKQVLKILGDADYASLQIDDKFNVNSESVEALVSTFQKDNDFYFIDKTVSVSDSAPTSKISQPKKLDHKNMTRSELKQFISENGNALNKLK